VSSSHTQPSCHHSNSTVAGWHSSISNLLFGRWSLVWVNKDSKGVHTLVVAPELCLSATSGVRTPFKSLLTDPHKWPLARHSVLFCAMHTLCQNVMLAGAPATILQQSITLLSAGSLLAREGAFDTALHATTILPTACCCASLQGCCCQWPSSRQE
jgi:hypothetical protein